MRFAMVAQPKTRGDLLAALTSPSERVNQLIHAEPIALRTSYVSDLRRPVSGRIFDLLPTVASDLCRDRIRNSPGRKLPRTYCGCSWAGRRTCDNRVSTVSPAPRGHLRPLNAETSFSEARRHRSTETAVGPIRDMLRLTHNRALAAGRPKSRPGGKGRRLCARAIERLLTAPRDPRGPNQKV